MGVASRWPLCSFKVPPARVPRPWTGPAQGLTGSTRPVPDQGLDRTSTRQVWPRPDGTDTTGQARLTVLDTTRSARLYGRHDGQIRRTDTTGRPRLTDGHDRTYTTGRPVGRRETGEMA